MKNLFLFLGVTIMLNANPPIGFGTWPNKSIECTKAVEEALELGYTIFDTATFYDNFEAIRDAIINRNREELTIISKVWPSQQSPADLKSDLEDTLKRLNTPYIDIYLLHWPNSKIPIYKTLQAMEELRKGGKIRQIGVSNFTVNHLKKALELGIPISWNQIELSPQFYDPELLTFCHANGIGVQAYSPLGRGELQNDPLLQHLGAKYGKTPAQIALRWAIQHHTLPLPSSKNPKHIAENLDLYDFELTQKEMQKINTRAKNGKRNRITPENKLNYVDEFEFTYEQCWPEADTNTLMMAVNDYMSLLTKIGAAEIAYPSQAIMDLCTTNCRKVRNGKLLFEGREFFPTQLDAGKQWLGSWKIDIQEILTSTENRTATIRYLLSTEKEGDLMVIAILHFDANYLISAINEVHNKLEI